MFSLSSVERNAILSRSLTTLWDPQDWTKNKHFQLVYGNWIVHESRKPQPRLTIKIDRLIVLSESSILGWFLHVPLIVIIKGRSPMEVSLIVIIK
jgi:hypothetical protein